MKKIMCFAVMLLVAAGCARELEVIDLQEENPVEAIEETPQVTVIHAGFENPETKTSIQMNDAGTVAKVLWTAGDQIRLLGRASSGGYYSGVFSTSDDGVPSADFSCSSWNPNHDCDYYYGFYPSGSFQGHTTLNGDHGLGAVIPDIQTAVPEGIAEGLNISYASTSSISETFQFRNIPSLIRFKMSGDVVRNIFQVKFIANSTISGECIVFNLGGTLSFDFNRWFGDREKPSSSVLLNKPSGGFQADVYYYIAVFPCTTEGFSMAFFNEDGEYIIKNSTKTLNLERSKITDFGTINVGDSFGDSAVTKYISKTTESSVKPVDIVVVPDGFTKNQRELFEDRAKEGIDFLFDTEPYKSYKKYFNVYIMWAASKDEGASVTDGSGNITDYHDTAFGSRWGADKYDDMDADPDKVFGFVSSHCPEIVRGELTIDEVPILMIINDTRYGGRAKSYSSGRTYCLAPFTFNGGAIHWPYPNLMPNDVIQGTIDPNNAPCHDTNDEEYASVGGGINSGTWKNTLVHEFGGHSFGRLADEYWYDYWYGQGEIDSHTWTVQFGLNISGIYGTYLWQDLLDMRDYLISNHNYLYNRIGVFQGAGVSLFNRWRSEMVSCMIDNRQYFSTWQRVLIVKRILDLAGIDFDMDSFLETDNPVDPVRDSQTAVDDVNSRGPIRIVPLLPPPILVDNTSTLIDVSE